MAEINQPGSASKSKRTFCIKRSTRVDLTPMVDLGFILITFFIFTSTLSELKVMNIVNPNDKDTSINDPVCASCALTILLGKTNQVYYYEGLPENATFIPTSYHATGLRKLMTEKKYATMQKRGADEMVVIIKPGKQSQFKNLVDVMDECAISEVKKYYIDELSLDDENKMRNIEALKIFQ
jgi:biopolymer transport protein ExbD